MCCGQTVSCSAHAVASLVCDLWFVYMVARPECVVSLPGYQTFSKGGKEREREGGMRENVFKL